MVRGLRATQGEQGIDVSKRQSVFERVKQGQAVDDSTELSFTPFAHAHAHAHAHAFAVAFCRTAPLPTPPPVLALALALE
jgi:hypothetical protein